jgi:hypothetical protein
MAATTDSMRSSIAVITRDVSSAETAVPRDVYVFTLPTDRAAPPTFPSTKPPLVQPSRLYGENWLPSTKAGRSLSKPESAVPMRVPVHYTYPEAFGNAQVTYCFPLGKFVGLASGGVRRIERVTAGTKFKLEGGGIATVTAVEPLMPWPEEHKDDGKRQRRVIGTVKHTGAIVLDVIVGQTTLTTTPGHLFWSVTRNEWVPAKSLKRGELLRGANGQTHPVGGVSAPRKALVDLHNIEVEIDHTYFVGNPPILVHNGYDCIKVPAWEQELADADRLTVKSAEDALGGIHGNSLDAAGEHSVYGVIDNETGELLHIGETGDLDARLADHVRDFAKLGIDDISSVTFEVTEGKAAAKLIETELITLFKDLLGYDLPYNAGYH